MYASKNLATAVRSLRGNCDTCAELIQFCECQRVETYSATDDITMIVSSVAVATTVLLVLLSLWSVLCVTLVHGTSFQYFTDQWAVEIIDANVSYAKEVAQRHGFTYVTTVSNFKRINWTFFTVYAVCSELLMSCTAIPLHIVYAVLNCSF